MRQDIRPPYTMVLTASQAEKRRAALSESATDDIMGQAVPAVWRAHVFYDRVKAKVLLPHRDVVTLLGYAMAHELGHLLLGPDSHSTTGVMRPNFDGDPRLVPSFTRAEASAIRRRLLDDAKTMNVGSEIRLEREAGRKGPPYM